MSEIWVCAQHLYANYNDSYSNGSDKDVMEKNAPDIMVYKLVRGFKRFAVLVIAT